MTAFTTDLASAAFLVCPALMYTTTESEMKFK